MRGRVLAAVMAVVMTGAVSGLARADLCSDPVMTESGEVRGVSDELTATCSWKGVPFAAPPVGELRFRAPQPAPPWEGVREAAAYSKKCMQVVAKDDEMSEDCLYLNVWRPRKPGKFPVMVWIHGGGYIMGSGGEGATAGGYDGSRLSAFGEVVVVTINYRLHAFGFLADPGLRAEDPNQSTGNYGSLDQVAALRWVHDNIEAFGGDSDNITIFGESAGGWSICTMLATPLNRGLFHRAIMQSGGCEKSESLEQGYERARIIYQRVGCKYGDLACLRQTPAKKILGNLMDLYYEGMPYAPNHDGHLLDDTPLAMIRAGNYNRVPFMAGYNRNETDAVLVFRPRLWHAPPFLYQQTLQRNLGLSEAEARELAALYPLEKYDNRPRRALGQIYTHSSLACPTYLGLAAAAKHQPEVYLYRFDYDGMKGGRFIGAMHGLEIPLVFGSVGEPGTGGLYDNKNIDHALALSEVMQSYWTNFAKTGDPNGPGIPAWPRFTPEDQVLQVLDVEVRAEPAGIQDQCSFWDDYYDKGLKGFEEGLGKDQR